MTTPCSMVVHPARLDLRALSVTPLEVTEARARLLVEATVFGLGDAPRQTPALVVEPRAGSFPATDADRERLVAELRELAKVNPASAYVKHIVFQRALPVDVRHNAKIHRLQLAKEWSARLAR